MDDTVKTVALKQFGRAHWKTALHACSWAVAALVTVGVGMGHKQANTDQLAANVSALTAKVDGMQSQVEEVRQNQAEMKGTLTAINGWAQGVAKFQAGVQAGAAEALATPVPKGPTPGHRTHKQ